MSKTTNYDGAVYTAPGMPPLDMNGKQTSFFEFWPSWVIYFPVVIQSLILAIRYGSLTLPLIANPKLPLSGMVGMGKSFLLGQAKGSCHDTILAWFVHKKTTAALVQQTSDIETIMTSKGFEWPVVCKPDIGCRGSGVKLVKDMQQLSTILDLYPTGSGMMIQSLASWEPEAGVFYIRHPDQNEGVISSLALKYTPYVIGDGESTLQQLIAADQRASELEHLYTTRHQANLATVIPKDEPYRLVFSASHCRGAIFRNANHHITPELTTQIDLLMKQIPEFYYGRLDIKFRDIESLKRGEGIEIIEINSGSSESLHIWDRNTSLFEALGSLLFQYRTLFKLGAYNRSQGYKPPKISELLSAWKKERELTKMHPETD